MNGISEEKWLKRIKTLMDEGLDNVIIREKEINILKLEWITNEIKKYKDENNLRTNIILHSNFELAEKLKVDGVHIPYNLYKSYDDEMKNKLKKWKRQGKVGFSVHSIEEIREIEFIAEYVLLSPVFKPSCKEVYGKGIEWIRDINHQTKVEIVALGGITTDNVQSVYSAGINSVGVMSALMNESVKVHQFKRV